jgi:hypothetical protein
MTVSRSSVEAEYRGIAHVAAECCWLRNLLDYDHLLRQHLRRVFFLSENPVHHRRTKHVELNIHFVKEKVAIG